VRIPCRWALGPLALALVFLAGCEALGRQPVRAVIIEGIVQAGTTYRVEPLDVDLETWNGPGVPAEVRVENVDGERIGTTCDEHGRFRVGPIEIGGRDDDRLAVICPGTRSLCLSALLPPEVHEAPASETVIVRWRITLPRRVVDRAGQGDGR